MIKLIFILIPFLLAGCNDIFGNEIDIKETMIVVASVWFLLEIRTILTGIKKELIEVRLYLWDIRANSETIKQQLEEVDNKINDINFK